MGAWSNYVRDAQPLGSDREARDQALDELRKLTVSQDNRQPMWDDMDLRTTLVSVAQLSDPEDLTARKQALRAVGNLAVDAANRESMWEDAGLRKVLIEAAENQAGRILREKAVTALSTLAMDRRLSPSMLEEGILEILQTAAADDSLFGMAKHLSEKACARLSAPGASEPLPTHSSPIAPEVKSDVHKYEEVEKYLDEEKAKKPADEQKKDGFSATAKTFTPKNEKPVEEKKKGGYSASAKEFVPKAKPPPEEPEEFADAEEAPDAHDFDSAGELSAEEAEVSNVPKASEPEPAKKGWGWGVGGLVGGWGKAKEAKEEPKPSPREAKPKEKAQAKPKGKKKK